MFLGEDQRKDKWEKRYFMSLKIEHEGYYIQIKNVEPTNLESLWDVYFWEVKMFFKFWYINLLYFRAKKNVEASQKKPNTENKGRTPTKNNDAYDIRWTTLTVSVSFFIIWCFLKFTIFTLFVNFWPRETHWKLEKDTWKCSDMKF